MANTDFVYAISAAAGIPEPALRLLFAVLLGYPFALVYRLLFLPSSSASPSSTSPSPSRNIFQNPIARNLYIATTGFYTAAFYARFEWSELYQCVYTVLFSWILITFVHTTNLPRIIAATGIWIGNFTYLMYCYYHHASDGYDINFLTPLSVLCLRMISLGMDYHDGRPNAPPKSQKDDGQIVKEYERPLSTPPTLLETFGYSYCFGSYLIGPQFPFELYQRFLTLELYKDAKLKDKIVVPSSFGYTLRCILLGFFYLGLQQVATMYFNPSFLHTKEFAQSDLLHKLAWIWIIGKLVLNKYLGVWVINEGPLVMSGISYSGVNAKGNHLWDGLSNVWPAKFETIGSLGDVVLSFNINTNYWSKLYIFKRLARFKSKFFSSFVTLAFLAIWHGHHTGYFMAFLLEFLEMEAEKRIRVYSASRFTSGVGYWVKRAVAYAFSTFAMYYALVAFDALHAHKWVPVYNEVYWIGHWMLGVILGTDLLLRIMRRKKSGKRKNDGQVNGLNTKKMEKTRDVDEDKKSN